MGLSAYAATRTASANEPDSLEPRESQLAQVIEDDLCRQAPEQARILGNLVGFHVELHVPAKIRYALRERLDHVD